MAEETYFAARRCKSNDGSPLIILVSTKTGKRVSVDGNSLSQHGCGLGDFLSFNGDKLTKKGFPTSTVVGDVAFADNIRAKLVNVDGVLLFHSYVFSDALCKETLSPGDYEIKINLRESEFLLPSGVPIHFEATNARPNTFDPTFTPISGLPPTLPPRPPAPHGVPSPSPSFPGSSNSGSRAPTPAGNVQIIRGAGFQSKPKPKNSPKPNNKQVPGTGIGGVKGDEQGKKEIIVGAGFALPEKKKDEVIVGAGFEAMVQKRLKLKAVVLSVSENQKTGSNTHFLWILDRQSEGRFVSKDYKLLSGHFFEGTFIENKQGKWNCELYDKQIDKPSGIDGGLDSENKIWFSVTVNNFRPAGANRRFGSASAKYFGEVVEGELESTKLSTTRNGKKVKIQRKGIAEKDYVWMVTELL